MTENPRLLISVFNPQETREAIAGGARVIDCEDPSGALGDISPQRVMQIADAILGFKRNLEVQISTNIGENQLLFKRGDQGQAVQRYENEIAGKAAQAALGVAAAMGTDVHPVNIVKVGLDNMPARIAKEVLKEVVDTLNRSGMFARSQVIAVFFAQDLDRWRERKSKEPIIRDLLLAREYSVVARGKKDSVCVSELFGGDALALAAIKARLGQDDGLFEGKGTERTLIKDARVDITDLYSRKSLGFSDDPLKYLGEIADLTADSGADGVMIDTRIHSKIAGVCCLSDELDPALDLKGIYTVADFERYARYCHAIGIEFWASGGVKAQQAQKLWKTGVIDGMAVRSGASEAVKPAPFEGGRVRPPEVENRGSKRIARALVAKYRPDAF